MEIWTHFNNNSEVSFTKRLAASSYLQNVSLYWVGLEFSFPLFHPLLWWVVALPERPQSEQDTSSSDCPVFLFSWASPRQKSQYGDGAARSFSSLPGIGSNTCNNHHTNLQNSLGDIGHSTVNDTTNTIITIFRNTIFSVPKLEQEGSSGYPSIEPHTIISQKTKILISTAMRMPISNIYDNYYNYGWINNHNTMSKNESGNDSTLRILWNPYHWHHTHQVLC